ncbi:DUF498-domain-containing protein, partial [Fimicolochytrium jonesii]|uniref:DUF498-domain-containing protein n=1 Tax=Fimicolochytrium jonesii TaxID=1396493 RepID=UPI0022FF2BDD
SVGNKSFTIGETRVQGPVIVANGHIFLWDVPQFGVGNPASPFYGWTEDCLRIFEVMENAPEIIVIGTGAQVHPLPPHLKRYLHSLGMQTEVLASRQAASTYNILVQEGRRPAAALLPPVPTSARTGQ